MNRFSERQNGRFNNVDFFEEDDEEDDDDYENDDINVDELYEVIKEQVLDDVNELLTDYMTDYTQKIKAYVSQTISANNEMIEEYLNEIISSLDISGDTNDYYEDDEVAIDEDIKNKFSKMVTHKKENNDVRSKLKENMNNIFNSSDDWETFPATSQDAMGFGQMVKGNKGIVSKPQNVNLRNYLPPDEGRGNDPELGTHHRESILDVAGAIPDDSVTKALTKDYSKMFKK